MRIVAVGECTRDRYVDLDVETAGGISLNFAVHARACGAGPVAVVSCTGPDAAGAAARRVLAGAAVDATRVHTAPGATASQVIHLAPGGERIFPPGGFDPGVLAGFRLDAEDLAFVATFDVVAGAYFRQVAHLFHPAMAAAAPTATRVADLLDGEDLGPGLAGIDPLLDTLDLAFLSGGDEAVERLLPRSRDSRTLIVVTRGASGSSALLNGRRIDHPAVAVPVAERIDTTGCGDAFQAAFTVSYLRHGDVPEALRAGAERAALVIRHLGATGELSPRR